MKKQILKFMFTTLIVLATSPCIGQSTSQIFNFEFSGKSLNGILDIPENETPKGIVLIVHGSGQTNAIAQNWYADIRESILKAGYGTYMWDKMGCGQSEGTFDYHQPIQNSALEVIAAITALKEKEVPGASNIGLWGISRAGWINPLVINQYKNIRFWISVSGVDAKENFKYLLSQNLRIEGHSKVTIELLRSEWQKGTEITHSGGSFEAAQEATEELRKNSFVQRFNNYKEISREDYNTHQRVGIKQELDTVSGLPIYIKDFDKVLSSVECPVLALFGEKDMNVDWKQTKALYERTLGQNTDLTIQSFSNGNHNLYRCETGGFYEFEDNDLPWTRPEGFLNAITNWLTERK